MSTEIIPDDSLENRPTKVRRGIPQNIYTPPLPLLNVELGQPTIALFAHALYVLEREREEKQDGEVAIAARDVFGYKISQNDLYEIDRQNGALRDITSQWAEDRDFDTDEPDTDGEGEGEVDANVNVNANGLKANLVVFLLFALIAWYLQNRFSWF